MTSDMKAVSCFGKRAAEFSFNGFCWILLETQVDMDLRSDSFNT